MKPSLTQSKSARQSLTNSRAAARQVSEHCGTNSVFSKPLLWWALRFPAFPHKVLSRSGASHSPSTPAPGGIDRIRQHHLQVLTTYPLCRPRSRERQLLSCRRKLNRYEGSMSDFFRSADPELNCSIFLITPHILVVVNAARLLWVPF